MRRPLLFIASAAAGAAVLTGVAACGSSSSSSAAATTAASTPTTATTPTTAADQDTGGQTVATTPSTSGTTVAVTLGTPKEFSLVTAPKAVPAGVVTFNVTNDGTTTHEFVIVKTAAKAGALPKDAQGEADETGNVAETGDMASGTTKSLTVTLKPGHYALICNLPGHYMGGMYQDFTVQ